MAKAMLIIDLPDNCKECVLYQRSKYFDINEGCDVYKCPFGCSHIGYLVKRPDDCPLKPVTEE